MDSTSPPTVLQLLRRVEELEADYRRIKRARHETWVQASKAGATQREIAAAAGVARGTVGDQLWMRG